MTIGGIYGEIASLEADVVRLEIDDDVIIRVARRAIAARVPDADDVAAAEAEDVDEAAELEAALAEPLHGQAAGDPTADVGEPRSGR